MNILVVIDMQKDFIDGALGTGEAVAMLPKAVAYIKGFKGTIFATLDTHGADYLSCAEGKKLPVEHCIKGTAGWALHPEIAPLITTEPIEKPTFGSVVLGQTLLAFHEKTPIESITFIGLCTDICVIANAMVVKAFLPEVPLIVEASCCAGVTPETHKQALEAMKVCQIAVSNEAS